MALADRAHKSSGKAFAIDLNQNVIDKILIDKIQKKSSEYGIQVFKKQMIIPGRDLILRNNYIIACVRFLPGACLVLNKENEINKE